jgi:dTDP-4-dehydrorhamnose 3,5-epimerase
LRRAAPWRIAFIAPDGHSYTQMQAPLAIPQGFAAEPVGPDGLMLVRPIRFADERGTFTILWEGPASKERTFWWQESEVHTLEHGTIRGLHYQDSAWGQAKLIRCIRGEIFDVVVHLATRQVTTIRLAAKDNLMFFVPRGFAHGYQTLVDNTTVTYRVSAPYNKFQERGLRYNDPALAITWPITPAFTNIRDAEWPLLTEAAI